ncbi:MAG: esterase/lipase family protein [Thermosynechococcaceae cyanobacterium]
MVQALQKSLTTHLPPDNRHAVVILIHGLMRSARSLHKLRKTLVKYNFAVIGLDYPSRSAPIAQLAEENIPKALQAANEIDSSLPVHFVTHSMGAILLRSYLQHHPHLNVGRTVMIAPPNQGSEVVDKLKGVPGFRLMNGAAGFELGTDSSSVPLSLGPVTYEVGGIAGVKPVNLLLSQLLPKPNDGKVSLESTKVEGMSDLWVVDASHTFIVNRPDVLEQTLTFLKQGQFKHPL